MNLHRSFLFRSVLAAALAAALVSAAAAETIGIDPTASPRIEYGAQQLARALGTAHVFRSPAPTGTDPIPALAATVLVGTSGHANLQRLIASGSLASANLPTKPEGFLLQSLPGGRVVVLGTDDSGALYGSLELARRVRANGGRLPAELSFADAPVLKLRGPCVGMQKTFILPGRHVYEYPYTQELFPFFYDKAFWTEYLDTLADQRMNTLYLWNGHPFASLVKLADYPYALEVSEEQFAANVAMFRYVAEEADKRGIWVVQMFYNILLSKPFAEKHGLPTQLNKTHPLAADYTRKSVAEFVRQYPHVGLMICLGEALQDVPMQNEWLSKVILPGVKDGMAAAGLKEEPPVVVRTHATDLRVVMPEALKVYKNLYTEAKFNGESLTTWEPRGVWQQIHLDMSKLGTTHLANIHILANLEPFRYGATEFIRKSVLAMRDRLGAGGLHLYPLAYWSWPDAPDKTAIPLAQFERDWIWFEAWSRYAWNPDREPAADRAHWIGRLTEHYGTPEAAAGILEAYNASGECAPMLLRRYGITEGNRQTFALGMTLDQLVTPAKYRPYPELWLSQAPHGERLQEFADKEWGGQPHEGETPVSINREVRDFSARAVAAIEAAAPHVTKNREEFARLRNDVYCIQALSENYAAKAEAALAVLRYQRSHDIADMLKARAALAVSLDHFRRLTALTQDTYHFANTMQTSQRRIPVPGGRDGQPVNYHWTHLLPTYETELADFDKQLETLRASGPVKPRPTLKPLRPAPFTLLSAGAETYRPGPGARVFTDQQWEIQTLAVELQGLTGIRFSHTEAAAGRMDPLEFETTTPVTVLVGYVQSKAPGWRQAPELETDALAGERGDNEPLLLEAASIDTLPAVHVYAVRFGPGRHRLDLRGNGSFLVLGVATEGK